MLCFIFSLQAVTAADVDVDDTNDDALGMADAQDVVDQSNNLSSLTLPANDEVLGEGEGSFTQLQEDISGQTEVTLTKNYTYVDSDSALKGGIPLSGNIKITGNNVVIDASHKARIFNIASGATVTLQGITFINANSDGNGGAIASQGVLSVENCKFINNTAAINGGGIYWAQGAHNSMVTNSEFIGNVATRSGGAIYWFGQNGTIQHSTFTDNKALGNAEAEDSYGNLTYGGNGGGIMWVGSNGTVYDCTFTGNTAVNHGGAVYLQGSSEGLCNNTKFDACTFTDNIAGINGGAINWYRGARHGVLTNSVFNDNIANRSGGAIFWSGIGGTISLSNFTNNKVLGNVEAEDSYGNLTYGGNGGAIMWVGSDGAVNDCTFTDNSAVNHGGAVYLQGSSVGICNNTRFDGCTFISNEAGVNGGAIDWYRGARYGAITNSEFRDNIANRSGGAVFWSGIVGTVRSSNFTNNTAKGIKEAEDSFGNMTYGGYGGAIMWTGSDGIIDDCRFDDNKAMFNTATKSGGRGGAVYLQGSVREGVLTNCSNTTFTNSIFTNNYAGMNGGAIAFDVGSYNCAITTSEFNNNFAEGDGGAVNIAKKSHIFTVADSVFNNDSTGDDGGAINWEGYSGVIKNITCYNCTGLAHIDPSDNTRSTSKGGTICLTGDNITVTESKFILGKVFYNQGGKLGETDGGALFVTGQNTTISHSEFIECSSPNQAGAIKVIGNGTLIDNCTFLRCTVPEDGGALFVGGLDCKVYNSTFTDNTAGDDGGAILWEGARGLIYNSTFTNNKAIGLDGAHASGGAINLVGDYTIVEKSKFDGNTAIVNGGSIYASGDYINITDSTFSNSNVTHTYEKNYAHGGGAIYIEGDDTNIINSTFDQTNARVGGVIYVQGDLATIIDSTITNSNAVTGGAIYIDGQHASVINSSFASTDAKTTASYVEDNKGGAIYILGNYATIEGSNFTRASAYQGGILYLQGKYCNVVNSSLDKGYSYGDGGAYYSTGTDSNVTDSNFTNNVARSDGGALFWLGSNYNYVIGCIFDNNTAYANPGHDTKGGGAIYFSEKGSYCGIKDSKFFNNSVQSTTKADGGAILWDKSSHIFIDGCLFDGNYVTSTDYANPNTWVQGGVMYARPAENLTITNSVFQNCWSIKEAGALYLQNGGNIGIHLINNTFINNTAYSDKVTNNNDLGGGAILVKGTGNGAYRFINSTFINNTANFGGAINLAQTSNNIIITNAIFDGNKATLGGQSCGQGGGIWTKVKFTVNNITFVNCEAVNRGGGLYISSNAEMTYTDLTFINNSAVLGGGLYWSKSSVTIDSMTFINNSAESGGAIYFPNGGSSSTPTQVKNSNFSGNSANNGGAIYINNVGYIKISKNNFTDNSAVMEGGAIYIPYSTSNLIDISYSEFIRNNASQGGAIYSGAKGTDTWNIHDCTFINNSATLSGGAIYVVNTQMINNCNFDGNKADGDGGAVYVEEGITGAKIQDSTFTNSHATNGGAVYYGGVTTGLNNALKIINDTFIKNIADYNGGAILYVTNNGINNYRDYNNFDGIGIPVEGGRTTVKANGTNVEIISKSLFEDNFDYKFLLRVISDRESPFIAVYLDAPRDWRANRLRFVVNLTNATTHEVISTVIVNVSNYDTHYRDGMLYVSFSNLIMNETYNITASFEDINYMYKVNSTEAQAHGEIIGEFKLLQRLIEDALARGDSEIVLNRTFTFTPFYMGKHDNMDDRCINLTNIDRPFTIRGEGWLIDAAGYSRIFYITSPYVTIENVVLVGGNASGEYGDPLYHDGDIGGAIYWAGANGTLIDSHVENNTANLGGAIYFNASAPNCKIINTRFDNNTAVTHGGAIDCNASKMELYNNTFRENFAYVGGALCREINSTDGRGVNNTFSDNNAEYAGAGIAWINATHISIDDYKFYNNHVGYSGGALYVGEGSLNCEILNCLFVNNAVDNETDGHGGAIEWYSEKGKVYNSVFINNHAYDGGAIYVGEGSGHINVTGSTFSENVALTTGGAISIEASAVNINDSYFHENIAKDGGAVYVGGEGTDNYVYSSVFEGNRAIGDENAMNGIGGAIDWVASSGTIVDTRFTDNCADYGGGVYFGGKSNASNIINCTFERNQAKYNGGAIDCNASMMYIEGTLFDGNVAQFGAALCRETNAKTGAGINNVFKNNHAIVAGAALGWMGSFGITITNYTFINNSADVAGGAIYASVDSHNCSVNDCTFEDNYVTDKTAGWSGGEGFTWIAWDGTEMYYRTDWTDNPSKATTADVLPTQTIFYYNNTEQLDAALGTGGAMTIFGANATITNSNFTGNRARIGGGVYIGASSGNADIDGTIWKNNVAKERGGALMIYASAVHVDDGKFYDNLAVNGSAIYVGGEGTENKVHRTIFEGNNATGYGGAIYWVAYVGEIHNSEFTKNNAEYGGGIYFNGRSANTDLINITFKSNNAVKNGGAIDCNASNIGIYNITFEENYAGEYGAALCRELNATGGHGRNNTFLRNHAGISGAGLAWMGVKDIHIVDYHFTDNTAERSGGAIFVDVGSDNDKIENCTFAGNHLTNMTEGHNGGAIDCRGKNLTIDYVDFTNNGAYTGGAIYVSSDSKNIHVYDSNFTENYAVGDGGALGLKAEALNINNTIFKSNTAGRDGGAVYAGGNGTNNTIWYSVFEDNSAGNHGGAIDWLASAADFEYLNFTRNSAQYGGGIYLNGVSTNSSLNHINFEENGATKNGGAIDCNATMMGLANSRFISNYAGEYGAALAREENATGGFGRNNTFINNHADIAGAALAWLGVDGVTINNYTFINNTAYSSGGAIFVREDSTNCNVFNSNFDSNYVTDVKNGQGGSIDWGGPNGSIENATFKDSFAVNGGTVYAGQNSDNLTVYNVSFISSRALGDGGAIALYGDNAKISYSDFNFTMALTSGGGISGHNANNATIDHCVFDYGMGAGYVDPTLQAYGEGGAIRWEDSEGLNVSNSQFGNIRSNSNGGVISAINTNASTLYNLTFEESYSNINGGSISWINSTGLTFDSLKVEDSEAHTNGGAVYLMGINDTTIKNSVFNNTISPRGVGGSMYINGNVTLQNNTFDGYEAYKDYGDSLFLENGNITVADSSFNGKDAIWINHDATAYLNNNNITGPNPNRDLYYLIDGYNELISYAIWNDGNMHLLGDSSYDYIIINNGTIWTPTTTKMMDNQTYNVTWNENFTFWAHIYDDSKYENTIISVNSLNTTNDVYQDVAHSYILPYNCLTLNCTYQGAFVLTPFDENLKQNTIYKGTLNVKMPVDLELIITNLDDYSVGVWAKLTPHAKSNYTIQGQTVTIKVGDEEYTVNITVNEQLETPFTTWTVGNASQFLNRLDAGEYTATASYAGDDVHLGVENVTKTFYIQLHDIWISLNITDIFYGQTIALNVTSNATRTKEGYVTIWINGKEVFNYIKLDGNGSSLLYLTYDQYKDIITQPGTQAGSISFTNGSYYNYQLNFTSFEVKKYHTNITAIATTPIDVGSPLIVNMTVNETATGIVKLTIDGKVHIEEIHNGTATFEIYGLAAGNYTNKTVEYVGNDWFDGNSTNITFVVVPKSDYVIDVLADNITYGNNATIRVIVPTDATGNITIYVDGNIVENVTIVNGIAVLNVVKPAGGEHVVNVTYNGDSAYSPKDKNGTKFMVNPNNTWDMTIIGDYKPYGENSTFTIRNIPADILGNNLTIKIDNVSYVVPINNGVATLTLNNLSAGQHSASVTYDGDANYINKTKKFFPDIPKATPTITLIQNGTDIIASVTGNVTGNVTFLVNEVEYTVDLTSGRNATLVGKLKIGDNYVYATYNGDENYTIANTMGVFNVAKLNTTITVTPTNITFGQDEIITVSVDANATGFIAVHINDKIYVEYINGQGVATFNITGLAAGNYTNVRVTYYPTTTDYNGNNTTTSFRVDPTTDYKFNVIVDDIEYGQNATVRVIMDSSANGNATIYIDGIFAGNVTVTNGEVVLTNISGLAGGQHTVNVTYNGDSLFAPKDNSTDFMVNPNTSWKVNITEVEYRPYGETSTINITNIPSDFTGKNLTIRIDGVPYVVPIVDGKATLSLNNLSAGPHMATVNYEGDANYSAISQVFRPNIPQATPTITLTEVDGDIVATVSGNTTGNVTFYVNGETYTVNLTSGNATLTKDHLSIGNNSVVAIYNGDKNYTSARTVGNFTVDKLNSTVNVTVNNTVYGNTVEIVVQAGENQTGFVEILVNGKTYVEELDQGIAKFYIDGLDVKDNYTVNVTYYENEKYHLSVNSTEFNVTKANMTATVVGQNVTVEQNPSFTIDDVAGDFKGNVTIVVNDHVYYNGTVKSYIEIARILQAANYTANVTFYGDNNYNDKSYLVNFTVSRVDPAINVTIDDVTYPANASAVVTVSNNANGTIEVYLGGTLIGNGTIVNGQTTTINLNRLSAGAKEVTVKFITSDEYNNNATETAKFNVIKGSTTVTIERNGTDVIAIVTPGVTGNVTFYINGEEYENVTVNGNATIVGKLYYGNNTVTAIYRGNENYTGNDSSAVFEIDKITTDLTVEATPEVVVGKNTTITVTMTNVTSGKVVIEVNGFNYTVDINSSGIATLVVGLPVGNYAAHAYYLGDAEHGPSDNVSSVFKVINKTAPSVIISDVHDIEIDSNLTFTVTTNSNATLVVKVNGVVVEVGADGKYHFNGTVAQLYNITASVAENDYYFEASNYTTFNVYKHASEIISVVGTPEVVFVGYNTTITVTMANNETGKVLIEVNGYNYTVTINDEHKAVLTVALPAGNYTAHAYYLGDDKYNATDKVSEGFNVTAKENATVIINAADVVVVDGKLVFNVTNSTPVVVTIDGVVYNATNGNYTFDATTVGEYEIIARTAETDGYYSGFDSKVFRVIKHESSLNVTAEASDVAHDVVINVTIPANATGYVIVNVNGTNYTVNTTGGNGVLVIKNPSAGDYWIHATYIGDDKYLASTNDTATFNVAKLNATVTIDVDNITYGENATVTVTVPNGVEGNITITLNDTAGTSITQTIVDGKAVFNIAGLAAGNYTVDVSYNGNEYYNINDTESDKFEVRKADPELTILTVTGVVYDKGTLQIIINGETAGEKVNITVVGEGVEYHYTVDIPADGMISFETPDTFDEYKPYHIIAEYGGNANFTSDVSETYFTPSKVNTFGITINPMNITVGDDEIITVIVPDHVDDVVIWVNGESYRNHSFIGNTVTFNVTGLKEGIYTVTAHVNDTEFDKKNFTALFTVNKTYPSINITVIDADNIHVGDTVEIIVTVPEDAVENVTIIIDGKEFTNTTVNGNATFHVPDLFAGNKTVTAIYYGDDKYRFNATTAEFTVSKYATNVNITVGDRYEIESDFIIQIGNDTAVNVTINGKEYPVVDGKVVIDTTAFAAGNYTVTATIYESDKYLGNTTSKTFTIFKHDAVIDSVVVPVANITVGQNATIAVTMGNVTSGKVIIEVGGHNYTVDIIDKVATLVVALPEGEYTAHAYYLESDKYNATDLGNVTAFNVVAKQNATIIINAPEVVEVDGKLVFNVTNSTPVVVTINDVVYTPDANGNYTFDADVVGNYTIIARSAETDEYYAAFNSTVFEVIKHASSVNITVNDKYEIESDFTIGIENNTAVNVTINGVPYTVVDGKVVIDTTALAAGNYTVTATVYESGKYYANSTTETFTIFKHAAVIDSVVVPVANITVGQNATVTVTMGNVTSGKVIIEVGGHNYTVDIVDKVATLVVGLPEGKYTAHAYYLGDDKYNATDLGNATAFNVVAKQNATVIINAADVVEVDGKLVFTVTNSTPVVVTINDVVYTPDADGKYTFDAEVVGNYTIVARTVETDGYYAGFNSTTFLVVKHASSINVTGDEIKVGENATISIEAPNYNGTAIVNVNGVNYYVEITNGVGQLNVAGLKEGTYDVNVTYIENDKYLQSTNNSAKVIVTKVENANINVTVENITEGEPAIVKVTVPEDATGNVTVTIGNITKTVPVSGGENEIIILDVPKGEHNVTVTYNGDDKYAPVNATDKINVAPKPPEEGIDIDDLGNGTVIVNVPGNATGNVTIKIGDHTYNATVVNGTATVNLVDEVPGAYNATVIYTNNDGLNATTTKLVHIPKYSTPMSIEVENANVGDVVTVVVNAGNVSGNVTIEINGVNYTAKVEGGKATFTVENLTAGNKTIVATYAGDDSYEFNSTTEQFEVFKNNAPMSVSAAVNGAEITITLSDLPSDATGYVIIDVNGTEYGINITKTKSITISVPKAGKYDVEATYLGDDKYLSNVSSTSFEAQKASGDVFVEVDDTVAGNDVVVKVTVPDDAKGNVTVKIGNTTKVVNVTGGENTISIPGIEEGTHDVEVIYSGDDQYSPETINTTVTVFKSIIADNLTRGWNSPYDFKAEFLDSKGHVLANTDVQFIVDGKTYTVKTDDQGIAYLTDSQLAVGKHDVTIVNTVTGEQKTAQVTIVKRLLENKDITMDFADGTSYVVKAIGDDGKPVGEGEFVDVYVNGIHYSVKTDKNGYAKLKINLNPKTYTITAEYKLTKVSNKIVVKQTLKLVKTTVKVKRGKNLVLQAKLKWSNGKAISGKKIVFKFNGKKYSAKTNSKGIAKVTIKGKVTKKLKKGKKYTYSATYISNTVKGKVKVK